MRGEREAVRARPSTYIVLAMCMGFAISFAADAGLTKGHESVTSFGALCTVGVGIYGIIALLVEAMTL